MINLAHLIKKNDGFSLMEMAIVLTIVGLLLAGLLPTLSNQIGQQRLSETRKYMNDVREALVGYAIINNHLPCPDTNDDGVSENPCTTQYGKLPYNDLGVLNTDSYGNSLTYAVTAAFASSPPNTFTLSTTGIMRVCTTVSCTSALATSAVAVIVSRGENWGNSPTSDEAENTNSDSTFVSRDFEAGGFDDILLWVSTNTLSNRMVAAGKLP
jgi:prepilin-type N-terminal cleavage/methylation domain-containing protein